jgi:hypothetical protein
MIKTDAQLERTLQLIHDFEEKIAEVKMIDDPIARELTSSSFLGMIKWLQLEVERYQNAKNGLSPDY